MVKYLKYIVTAVILTVLIVILVNIFEDLSPESQIRKQLDSFLETASKSSGDKLSSGLIKSKSLEKFFVSPCSFQIGVSSFSGRYTREDISGNSMRYRSMFKYIKFSAYDIEIILTSQTTATVNFTGALNGVTKHGESIDDYKDLSCEFKLVEGKWLISSVSVREILKK